VLQRRRKGTASKQRQLPAAVFSAPQCKLAQRMLARLAAKQQRKAELLFA
jgi:3-hydroxy-3-methylglutaryl CoA synthase